MLINFQLCQKVLLKTCICVKVASQITEISAFMKGTELDLCKVKLRQISRVLSAYIYEPQIIQNGLTTHFPFQKWALISSGAFLITEN